MKLSQFKFKLPEDKIALHPTLMIKMCLYSTIQRCSPLVCTVIKKRRVLVLKYSYCVS